MGCQETADQRRQHQLAGGARGVDAQRAERRIAKGVDLFERTMNVQQGRGQPVQQALAGFGRRHAARGAVEQPYP